MSSEHHGHSHPGAPTTGGRKHMKWITVVGLVLMLGAMAMYILSLDESVQPGQPEGAGVPMAAE